MLSQWAKSPKKQFEGVRFCSFEKYTPTDCFFGDFAYWGENKKNNEMKLYTLQTHRFMS